MTESEFISELHRKDDYNDKLFLDGTISEKKYRENENFYGFIGELIEEVRELRIDKTPNLDDKDRLIIKILAEYMVLMISNYVHVTNNVVNEIFKFSKKTSSKPLKITTQNFLRYWYKQEKKWLSDNQNDEILEIIENYVETEK